MLATFVRITLIVTAALVALAIVGFVLHALVVAAVVGAIGAIGVTIYRLVRGRRAYVSRY